MLKEILESTVELFEKEDYKTYFAGKLKKYGIKSPSELKGAEKKKFFDEVDKDFDAENEND